jgi:hypothetical protein
MRAASCLFVAVAIGTGVVGALVAVTTAEAAGVRATLRGQALSGRIPVASTPVTLYRTNATGAPTAVGRSRTCADGSFAISYRARQPSRAVLYVVVGRVGADRLAAALGTIPVPGRIVVNELTTVAAGFALAQFDRGADIGGKAPGPQNAAAMSGDLADVRTGGLSRVLLGTPNGNQTSTLREFNSLANMLVPCVRSRAACARLFRLARPPGGEAPSGTLAAVADIARDPWHNVRGLFALARSNPAVYRPALSRSERPDAWILALRFYGDGKSMNAPGNSAIDAAGNIWVDNNYTYSRNPTAPVCGSKLFFKLTPTGRYAPGSPYSGGGIDGSGYGVAFDPRGNVWVGNFGFSSTACTAPPPHNSVSEFTPRGKPVSPSAGFTQGGVSWPQGVVSDRRGNIWIENCGNNTVTRYAGGDPRAAVSFGGIGLSKPFDLAFNQRGQAFVTGNGAPYGVAVLNPDGSPTAGSPITGHGLNQPLGIAADTAGNMWVANSALVSVPCPTGTLKPTGPGSVLMIAANGVPRAKPFTGGGLTNPWGIAVDGNDNVWVANFSRQRVSELCGIERGHCPPGTRTGQAISPRTGYGFNGLVRNTSVEIDPSGNVWITNNWKNHPLPTKNPGGYEMVAYIGVAGPLQTPLIGPPNPL